MNPRGIVLNRLYEGMFLVDNDLVREDWSRAKGSVTDLLEKHGAELKTVRRFAERKLAYPIKRRMRGTYILTYFELDGPAFTELYRDLDLSESILRYLMIKAELVPDEELELSEAEKAPDFEVPDPPADDAPEEDIVFGADEDDDIMGGSRPPRAADKPIGTKPAEAKPEEGKADEAKADEAKAEGAAAAEGEKPADAAPAAAEPATATAATETAEPTKEA